MVKTLNSQESSSQQITKTSQDDLPPPLESIDEPSSPPPLESINEPIIMTNRKSTNNLRFAMPRRESSTPVICSQFIVAMIELAQPKINIKLAE